MIALHLLLLAIPLAAQTASEPPAAQQARAAETPASQADAVSRTVKTINYQSQRGATRIGFAGSPAMRRASGEAKVESKRGYYEIEAEFSGLGPPTHFGAEYLTYVWWSVSPEGRTGHLGEVLVDDNGRAKLTVTSELQVFGLIVTAEP
jgi:outer membrane protein TolC